MENKSKKKILIFDYYENILRYLMKKLGDIRIRYEVIFIKMNNGKSVLKQLQDHVPSFVFYQPFDFSSILEPDMQFLEKYILPFLKNKNCNVLFYYYIYNKSNTSDIANNVYNKFQSFIQQNVHKKNNSNINFINTADFYVKPNKSSSNLKTGESYLDYQLKRLDYLYKPLKEKNDNDRQINDEDLVDDIHNPIKNDYAANLDNELLDEYTSFISDLITDYILHCDYIDNKVEGYFNLDNLKFLKFKNLYIDKLKDIQVFNGDEYNTIKLSLGKLTFYDQMGNLLLDIPYKKYYNNLNAYVKEHKLLKYLFSENINRYEKGKNYIFYEFYYYNDANKITLKINNCFYRINSKTKNLENADDILKKWLRILFSEVYYLNFYNKDQNIWNEININGNIVNSIIQQNSSLYGESPFYFVFFFEELDIAGQKGTVNYCLYSDSVQINALRGNRIPINENNIEEFTDRIYSDIRPLIISRAQESIFPLINNQIRKLAVQSAVSSIFARNYSHNIGAHVDNRTYYNDIIFNLNNLYGAKAINDNRKLIDVWIHLMKDLMKNYSIKRNEFLADYQHPPKNLLLYEDIILPFVENMLLMNNIASSEDIMYFKNGNCIENKLKIKVNINGNELSAQYPDMRCIVDCDELIEYPDHFPYVYCYKGLSNPNNCEIEDLTNILKTKIILGNDIEISITNEHAFFSILENIIRNSSKHNKKILEDESELLIQINVYDTDLVDNKKDNNFYHVIVYDNISEAKLCDIWEFKRTIESSIINIETAQLERKQLGIKDMKINAHLLCSSEEINDDILKKSLEVVIIDRSIKGPAEIIFNPLQYRNYDELLKDIKEHYYGDFDIDNYKFSFGYKFKLQKSKKIMWVVGNDLKIDGKVIDEFQEKGVTIFSYQEDLSSNLSKTIASYQFIVFEREYFKNFSDEDYISFERCLTKLPFRLLLNSEDDDFNEYLSKLINSRRIQLVKNKIHFLDSNNEPYDVFSILKACWINWLDRWDNGKRINLIISDKDKSSYFNQTIGNEKYSIFHGDYSSKALKLNYNERYVIFDRHGDTHFDIKSQLKCFEFGNLFYQTYEKNNDDFNILNQCQLNELSYYQLIEAALVKILIADERLCAYMNDKLNSINTNYNIINENYELNSHGAALTNIFFVNSLENNIISKTNASYACYINNDKVTFNFLNKEIKTYFDCIIVHRTFINEHLLRNLRTIIPNIIITSGGGSIQRDEKYKFKPLSLFQGLTSNHFSKITLTKNALT